MGKTNPMSFMHELVFVIITFYFPACFLSLLYRCISEVCSDTVALQPCQSKSTEEEDGEGECPCQIKCMLAIKQAFTINFSYF